MPTPLDLLFEQPIGSPPNAPDPRPTQNPLDNFLARPSGRFLANLLAQSGYSTVPSSPLGAIGRAALLSQEQNREDRALDIREKLLRNRLVGTPAGQREFEAMVKAAREDNPNVLERDAALISLGINPRAGISAKERIAGDPELTSDVAGSQAEIAGAVEGAKADVQREAEVEKTNQERAQTLAVWEASKGPLMDALEGTITGPVPGLSPALTSKQQIADGAIAAVAPVLKQLFRAAGEGIFTDRDQQLLLEMVPDRSDHPEARRAKMEMIDAIIDAKLAPIKKEQVADKPISEMTDAELQAIIDADTEDNR